MRPSEKFEAKSGKKSAFLFIFLLTLFENTLKYPLVCQQTNKNRQQANMIFQFACRKLQRSKDLEPARPSQFYSLMNGALCLFYTLYAVRYTSFCRLLSFVYRLYSTLVESPLQINPFYAKQTQFSGCTNECKYLLYKGLSNFYPACGAKKQTQFKPNCRKGEIDAKSVFTKD